MCGTGLHTCCKAKFLPSGWHQVRQRLRVACGHFLLCNDPQVCSRSLFVTSTCHELRP